MKNSIQRPPISRQVRRPNKDHIRSLLKTLLIKSAIVIIIIFIVLVLSSINSPSAQDIRGKINSYISYEFKAVEDSMKIYSWAKDKAQETMRVIPTMNTISNPTYIGPIKGTVYRNFKEEIQSNGKVIENGGLDIRVENEENPISIINGIVEEVQQRGKKGYYVTIVNEDIRVVYGYLKSVYVIEGEIINQGAEIGSLGTNKDGSKYLRLEMYRDNMAVDPEEYIDI